MSVASGPKLVTDGLVLCLDGDNTVSYSPNTFSLPLDIFGFASTASTNACTISRDTTISPSPAGGIPMKMAVTGNDPHIGSYNAPAYNVAAAAVGQTWTISVWVRASTTTTGELLILGADATGSAFAFPDIGATTINITTQWSRFSFSYTLTKAQTVFVQFRLDGTQTGGTGIDIWWDGVQFERGSSPTTFSSITNTNGVSFRDISGQGKTSTLINGPIFTDTSIQLDGVDDYVLTPRISGTGTATNNISWCVWTKPNGTAGNIMAMASSDPITGWNMPPIAATGSQFRGKIWPNNYLLSSTYTTGIWYYLCLVFDYAAGQQRFYVNSELVAQQTEITYSSSTVDNYLFFGQANPGADNTGYYTGNIGAVQVYSGKALNDVEVKQNFDAYRTRYGL
jgi:hypothetical protein